MILKGRRNKKEAVEKLTSDNILYVSVVVNNMLIDNMSRSHTDTYCLFYFVYVYMHKRMHICMCVRAQIWVCTYVCEGPTLTLVVFFSCPVYRGGISC